MLRWYQKQAVAAVWDYLNTQDGAPCVVLPTGSGKTHVIAEMCRAVVAKGGRALVLAHVKELLQQTATKLGEYVEPSLVGIYSAGLNERAVDTAIVVGGIQSVVERLDEIGAFQLIVVDEAHLIPPNGSGRYRRLVEAEKEISPNAKLVGLTATPYRMGCGWIVKDRADADDDEKYDRILDTIVYEAPVASLIADGTLSTVVSKRATRSIDYSGIKTTRGDFDEEEIEKRLLKGDVLACACQEIVEQTRERKKVLVFCNRLESARRCAKFLERFQTDGVAVVDGSTPNDERAAIVRRFKGDCHETDLLGSVEKPLKYVCNVGVLTTGFDAPNVDCVVMLRPTKSLALYQQIVGRGLRRSPDKSDCLILDYGGNVERLGPIDVPNPQVLVDGDVKWRTCPECNGVVKRSYPCCPLCGHVFPPPRPKPNDPDKNLEASASNKAILSQDDEPPIVKELAVVEVEYSEHHKKDSPPDDPGTLQIKYKVEGEYKPIFEWLCPEHENGWVQKRFREWWGSKSKVAPPLTTATAALWAKKGALATPLRIKTTRKPKEFFARIEWLEQSDKPDFDPNAIKSDFDEFFEGYDEFNSFDGTQEEPVDADPRAEAPLRGASSGAVAFDPTGERRDGEDSPSPPLIRDSKTPARGPTGASRDDEDRPTPRNLRECKNCGNWNDYGTEDFAGFCWSRNEDKNGTCAACSEHFTERFIDPDLPF